MIFWTMSGAALLIVGVLFFVFDLIVMRGPKVHRAATYLTPAGIGRFAMRQRKEASAFHAMHTSISVADAAKLAELFETALLQIGNIYRHRWMLAAAALISLGALLIALPAVLTQ